MRMFSRCLIQSVRRARIPRVALAPPVRQPYPRQVFRAAPSARLYSSGTADEIVEELQELYATAKDEFEIAQEETDKVSVYAEDDRKAAREELEKLQLAYKDAVEGSDAEVGEEIQRRVGQRIRELENAVANMEEQAMNQD